MPVVRLEGCDYARGIGWNTEANGTLALAGKSIRLVSTVGMSAKIESKYCFWGLSFEAECDFVWRLYMYLQKWY